MIVKSQKEIEFINTSDCVVDTNELGKAIVWYSKKPVARLKKIFMHGKYPAIAIHKEKIHVHRLLMMYWVGRRLESTEYVHHKDGCKLNALRSNLEIIIQRDHQSYHNKNKVLSESHRNKISEANRRRAGKVKFKKKHNLPLNEIMDFIKEGRSINFIAKFYKVDRSTIKNRIYEHPHLLKEESK